MLRDWVLCSSCQCHVRPDAAQCPHCGAAFASAGSTQKPLRHRFGVRRLFCASAVVGLGLPGCASKVLNEDVQGTCYASQAAPRCDSSNLSAGQCACGSGGVCKGGACVSCGCAVDEACNPDGTCTTTADYWFGATPGVSTSTCYGSPPLLT